VFQVKGIVENFAFKKTSNEQTEIGVSMDQQKKNNTKSRKFLLAQGGFSLMEMIVAISIGTGAILIFSSGVLATLNSVDFVQASATRDEIAFTIRRTILDHRSFKVSIEQNPVIKAITSLDFSGPVKQVYSGQPYGITLYDRSGVTVLAGPGDDGTNPEQPVYYKIDGSPCTTPGVNKCLLAVTILFSIQGNPQYKEPPLHTIIPMAVYPTWAGKNVKPDFMQFDYKIDFLDDGKNGIARKNLTGSVFIDFEDMPK
jgi:prepilin-type N-terminal cleavage/methylation domain-containing protein